MKPKIPILFILIIILLAVLLYIFFRNNREQNSNENQLNSTTSANNTSDGSQKPENAQAENTTVIAPTEIAKKLDTPWEMVFLPNNNMLITERSGNIKLIGSKNKTYRIEDVNETSEGGLLGMALHPNFTKNELIYIYKTTKATQGYKNLVERYRFDEEKGFSERTIIVDNIPGSSIHNGGRIGFGPDGYLYITTGDAGQSRLAQDQNSLAGKILRVDENGDTPIDNPFKNLTYSLGHRNPQGLAWDNNGKLWSTEHGPQAKDELNLIEKGKNYGWPVITGDEKRNGMISPLANSGANTWAPTGLTIINNTAFFGGLRGEALYSANITGSIINVESNLQGKYGRIRMVNQQNGILYFSTSNTDGRGSPESDSDFIIKMSPPIN